MQMGTVTAAAFADLIETADGFTPIFDDCKAWDLLPPNTKVRPASPLDGVTYGYTRSRPFYVGKELRVGIYWPQIKSEGSWPVKEIKY